MKKETDKVIDKILSGMDWDVIFEVNKCFKHGVGDGVSVIPGVKRKAFADGITKNDLKNELKSLLKYVIENNIPELIYGYWMIFWNNPLWTDEYLDEIKEEMGEDESDLIGDLIIDPTLEVIYSPQRMYIIANNIKNQQETVSTDSDALETMLNKALGDEKFELAAKIRDVINLQKDQK
jgi:hypothetical protein